MRAWPRPCTGYSVARTLKLYNLHNVLALARYKHTADVPKLTKKTLRAACIALGLSNKGTTLALFKRVRVHLGVYHLP